MKKVFILLFFSVLFSVFSYSESEVEKENRDYVIVSYKSSLDGYNEFRNYKKNTYVKANDLLKLKNPEYKFIGWEYEGRIVKNLV